MRDVTAGVAGGTGLGACSGMLVRHLMQRDVATLSVADRLDLADDIMRLGRIRHLPVVDGTRLVGILSQRDLFRAATSSLLQLRREADDTVLEALLPVPGQVPRFVRLPEDQRCEVRDNDALDAALALWPPDAATGAAAWLHRVERSWRLALASALALCAFGVASFVWGVPWAAKHAAFALPAEVTTKLGDETMAVFDRTLFEPSALSDERRAELAAKFAAFLRAAGESDAYRVEFRASRAMGANAFALPSGVIVLTDALVELAEDDAEILGVLAHEAGHVKHRHVLRGVLQNAVVALVVTLVTGDVSATTAAAGAAPAFLLQGRFSRAFEREADAEGVRLMRSGGLKLEYLAIMLERLHAAHRPWADKPSGDEEAVSAESGVMDYIGTHPPTHERLRFIRENGVEADEAK